MIKQLFLPEEIQGYYPLPTKMIGLHSTSQAVYATVLEAKAKTLKISGVYSQKIATDDQRTIQERTASAISTVLQSVGSYDSLVVTFPSSLVMFKELQFPFLVKEKIQQVIPFEIEAQLPVPLSDATFDFCITTSNLEQKRSTVIVAATQTKFLEEFAQIFETAHVAPTAITVDVLDLYGFYQKSAFFSPDSQVLAIIDDTFVYITYLHQGTLKTIRSIAYSAGQPLPQQFFFTVQSFLQEFGAIKKIVFMGGSQTVVEQAQQQLSLPCEKFNLGAYLTSQDIEIDASLDLQTINLISLAAAYPSSFTRSFNLTTQAAARKESQEFKQHVITATGITAILLSTLLGHAIVQITSLSNEIDRTKAGILKDLKEGFPGLKSGNVTEAVKKAKGLLEKEEEIWFSFSAQTRRSYLQQLYELSTKIESDSIGLFLKKLTFGKDTITFEGSVRSFEALAQFEHELKATNLFVSVPEFQKVEFSESLTLKAREERT